MKGRTNRQRITSVAYSAIPAPLPAQGILAYSTHHDALVGVRNGDAMPDALGFDPFGRRRTIAQIVPAGTSLSLVGNVWAVNRTATNTDDDTSPRFSIATPATNNNDASITTTYKTTGSTWNDRLACWISTAASIAVMRMWIYVSNSDMGAISNPTGVHVAGVRFDTGASDTTFRCITSAISGTPTNTDSSVTVATSSDYKIIIDFSSGNRVNFYINGTLVASHTTTLPTSIDRAGIVLRTLEAVAKTWHLRGTLVHEYGGAA